MMPQSSVASEKAEFEKLRPKNVWLATPPHKPTAAALGASGSTVVMERVVCSAGVGPIIQHQSTHVVGHPLAKLIRVQVVSTFPRQALVSSRPSLSVPSHYPGRDNFPMNATSIPTPPLLTAVPFQISALRNQFSGCNPSRNHANIRTWTIAAEQAA